jgi:soluble cytochrome b562
MTKEEFLELASKNWEKIKSHRDDSGNLYDYEKGFDELWVEFGRATLEKSIGEIPQDRRKKSQI